MKHTPGPWMISQVTGDADRSIYARTPIHGNPRWIARVYGDGITAKPNDENIANALLVVSAPELRAELEGALKTIAVLKTFCDVPLTVVRAAEQEIRIERLLARIEGRIA